MSTNERGPAGFKTLRSVKREALRFSPADLIRSSEAGTFPLVMRPNVSDLNLATWAGDNREFLRSQLLKHGAILFRDFKVDGTAHFKQFAQAISPDLLDYTERAAPRTEITGGVYTSTEFPANQYIPLHHEMSYSHNWPTKLWFFCLQAAATGGCTPLADDRKVFGLIPASIKERFTRKRVMYVRNYGEGVDLTWQQAFQTTDRAAVEAYCRRSHMSFEWKGENRLRTRQVRQAVATHPETGEIVWFNHTHLFHVSNLEPSVREALLEEFAEDELPRNAFYGDGSPIETSVLDEIRGVYARAAVAFPWQKNDILMVDNFLTSHGREPFTGERRILVAMAELYTNREVAGYETAGTGRHP